MQSPFLACLGSLVVWSLLCYAARRTVTWYALRTVDRISARGRPPDLEDLRDERAFVDGWRACEECRRIPPAIDEEHILHHYSFDGSSRAREKCPDGAA